MVASTLTHQSDPAIPNIACPKGVTHLFFLRENLGPNRNECALIFSLIPFSLVRVYWPLISAPRPNQLLTFPTTDTSKPLDPVSEPPEDFRQAQGLPRETLDH